MRYFVNEDERKASGSTCYFEFQKGKHRNNHWLKDSICIHADLFEELLLFHLFADSLGRFEYYGPTNEIGKEQWYKIIEKSKENEHWELVVEEMRPWAEKCFNKAFTSDFIREGIAFQIDAIAYKG